MQPGGADDVFFDLDSRRAGIEPIQGGQAVRRRPAGPSQSRGAPFGSKSDLEVAIFDFHGNRPRTRAGTGRGWRSPCRRCARAGSGFRFRRGPVGPLPGRSVHPPWDRRPGFSGRKGSPPASSLRTGRPIEGADERVLGHFSADRVAGPKSPGIGAAGRRPESPGPAVGQGGSGIGMFEDKAGGGLGRPRQQDQGQGPRIETGR